MPATCEPGAGLRAQSGEPRADHDVVDGVARFVETTRDPKSAATTTGTDLSGLDGLRWMS